MYSILYILYKCGYMWMEGQTVQRNTLFQQKKYPCWCRRPLNLTMNLHTVKKRKKEENFFFSLTIIIIIKRWEMTGKWNNSVPLHHHHLVTLPHLTLSLHTNSWNLLERLNAFLPPHVHPSPSNGQNVCVPPCLRPR